jgi:hypothetical protein
LHPFECVLKEGLIPKNKSVLSVSRKPEGLLGTNIEDSCCLISITNAIEERVRSNEQRISIVLGKQSGAIIIHGRHYSLFGPEVLCFLKIFPKSAVI